MLFPSHLTKYVAIRSPNPVFTNPRAKKKEMTISQMTSFVKALNAAENVRVRVITAVVRPRNAHAPTGRGLRTSPAMVERKMESNCQAWGVTATGLGTRNRTMRPIARDIAKGTAFAPCHAAGAEAGLSAATVDLLTDLGGSGSRGREETL